MPEDSAGRVEARTAPALRAEGLSRVLGGREVVRDVSLTLHAGKVTCLLGPSGCGKSTTLRILAGVERQDSGTVELGGQTVADGVAFRPPEARSVGMMFQDFALFPHLSAAKNVAFGLRGPRRERMERARGLLGKVGMGHHADDLPHQLSGGEQQRVALVRALAPRPAVMLMDEPFSGLDNRLRDGIRDETLDILKAEGAAVLLVTHEPNEAMRMADEIVLMRDGGIVQQGAPYNVYHSPVDAAAAAFFSDVNVIEGTCRGALTDTPFGAFLTPGHPDGSKVEIVFRPQHVGIDFDRGGTGPHPTPQLGTPARGTVRRARFMGTESLVEFVMDHDGSVVSALVPSVFVPKPGMAFWLTIRRDRCFVFAAAGPDRRQGEHSRDPGAGGLSPEGRIA